MKLVEFYSYPTTEMYILSRIKDEAIPVNVLSNETHKRINELLLSDRKVGVRMFPTKGSNI
jgi:exopolysaccharide biosynthesis protein